MSDLRTVQLRPLIDACAALAGLPQWGEFEPGEWLEGVILQESGGDPRARRYEPHQDRADRRDAAEDADQAGVDDAQFEDDASYGLMQVMGYNARRLCGVQGRTRMDFSFLYLPITGIAFGLRVLTGELAATGGSVVRALCRYNGGPTGDAKVDDGRGSIEFRRQEYVNGVLANAQRAQQDRRRRAVAAK